MTKFVPAAEPVLDPEPEATADQLAPNDDDEENLGVDDEPDHGPVEEPDDDILPLEDEEDAASSIGTVNGSNDE